MPSKGNKAIVRFLESNGFAYDRTNAKGFDFYTHPACAEVSVNVSIHEHDARRVMVTVQKQLGIATDKEKSKRSPEAVRERQAAERERLAADIARHEAEVADLLAQRDKRMDGLGEQLTGKQMRDIERLIEQKQRELLGWRRLMTEIPTPSAHSGRATAKHRA